MYKKAWCTCKLVVSTYFCFDVSLRKCKSWAKLHMYILRAYAGNDNATVDVNNWRRNFFLFFLHLHLAKEVIWNNREKDWKSTSSCFIIKKLFFLPLSWGIDAWRRKNYLRLRAVSLFSVVRRAGKTRETQMATRVTDGARWERHEKRETAHKARENGLSRSSDFWASKLKCWQARHVKRDLRVCLNNRGFPTFLFKAQLMQCIELESILN